MRKTQRKIICVSCFDNVLKNVHKFSQLSPRFSRFVCETTYKELEIVIYHCLKTPRSCQKSRPTVVFQHTSWCFGTFVFWYRDFCSTHLELFRYVMKRFLECLIYSFSNKYAYFRRKLRTGKLD